MYFKLYFTLNCAKLSNNCCCHMLDFVLTLLNHPQYVLDVFPVLPKLYISAFEQHLLCGQQPCQVNKALINY